MRAVWHQALPVKCSDNQIQNDLSNKRDPSEHFSKDNLIVGVAISVPIEVIASFVQSARLTCSSCMISLFIHMTESESRDFIDLANIYGVKWLVYEQFDISETYPEPVNLIKKVRWWLFSAYFAALAKENIEVRNVFIADVEGVHFQTNVFERMENYGNGIYVFTEDPPVLLDNMSELYQSLLSCFDKIVVEQLVDKASFSSSIILGSWDIIRFYAVATVNLISNHNEESCSVFKNDEHFQFYMIHGDDLPNRTIIHQIPYEAGFIATNANVNNMARNSFGLILNSDKNIYAVIHTKYISTNRLNSSANHSISA